MSALPELDWRTQSLPGRVLIEASAGTGKTWNIALLYLRLLLEHSVSVRQILVTTFTDAAAEELKARIRARLAEAEDVLAQLADGVTPMDIRDVALAEYLRERLDHDSARVLRHRLQLAQAEFDLAPVTTIHGFCSRVLRDFPFESAAPFALGNIIAADALVGECVEDFWRRRYLVGEVDAWERAFVLPRGATAVKRHVAALAQVQGAQILPASIVALQSLWRAWRAQEPAELADLCERPGWFASTRSAVLTRLVALRRALRSDRPEEVPWKDLCELLQAPGLQRSQRAGVSLAAHPIIQALIAVRPGMQRPPEQMLATVAHAALDFVARESTQRLAARGQLTYDSLIETVHARVTAPGLDGSALHADASAPFATAPPGELAERLFEAFPAALIDEFQDTDARQWEIFERIYAERGSLVLIGDPKQSIYGFRGGDLATYLQARERIDARRSLRSNHRSSAALIAAWNQLYALAGEAAFGTSQIEYQAVAAAGRDPGNGGYRVDGALPEQPLVLHLRAEPRNGQNEFMSALRACANDVASLLNDRRQRIDGKPLAPGHIAVLVDSNYQIKMLRQLLRERGVPVVGSGRANVFKSEWAHELKLWLYALLNANDARAIRAALATRLGGYGAARLQALAADAGAFERVLQAFAQRAERWRRLGLQAVLEELIASEAPRLLAEVDGERALTDLRHLGELLQSAAQQCFGPQQLYDWLHIATSELGDGSDEGNKDAQLRIESEAHRVQLLTVHAAKGLEFPIVFMPVGWHARQQRGNYAPPFARFHRGHAAWIDLGSSDFAQNLQQHFREELGERMRKLYVGLTRAQYALHLYGYPDPRRLGGGAEEDLGELDVWIAAALDRAVADADEGADPWATLAACVPGLRIETGFAQELVRYRGLGTGLAPTRAARTPLPRPRPWRGLHSFTSLSRPARAGVLPEILPGAQDEAVAEVLATLPEPVAEVAVDAPPHPQLLALADLRGSEFGDALHWVFEHRDFSQPIAAQRRLVEQAFAEKGVRSKPRDAAAPVEDPIARVATLVTNVLAADLGDGLHLATLPTSAMRAEFEFSFALEHAQLPALQRLLAAHGGGDWLPAREGAHELLGRMTGYIDLVFAWNGHFHVLDYKSNWLGDRLGDYQGARLDAAMDRHHYPLQALIYSVAVHRYLRSRIADYAYERHFGDCWYLFLRAVGIAPGAGVWRRRFAAELVAGMDRLFAGEVLA